MEQLVRKKSLVLGLLHELYVYYSIFYKLSIQIPFCSNELFSLLSFSSRQHSFSLAFFLIFPSPTPQKDERKAEGFDRFIACKSMKGATKNLRLNGWDTSEDSVKNHV